MLENRAYSTEKNVAFFFQYVVFFFFHFQILRKGLKSDMYFQLMPILCSKSDI